MSLARDKLVELHAKIEAFFARVRAREPRAITCARGCDDCCRRRFTVLAIEAELLRDAIEALDGPPRARLAERARTRDEVCPALEDDGACAVYAARPLVCRTHGLAIRYRPEGDRRALPLVDACGRNFSGRSFEELDPSLILDQELVSAIALAVDAARTNTHEIAAGTRVDWAEIILDA